MLGVRGMHGRLAGIMSSRHVSLGVNSQKEKGREGGKIGRELVTAGQKIGIHRCLETTAAGLHVVEIDWCASALITSSK